MSSIKDVARLAGVSFTTVSHVLNGTRKVSEDARQRVLRAVAESGYVPSALARSLRVAQTHTLGVLVPDISNPFCAEITLGVEEVARQAGYSVVLGNTGPQGLCQARHFDSLLGRRVDGVLLVAGAFEAQSLQQLIGERLAHLRTPLLLIDQDPGSVRCDGLQADQCAASRLATEHLLALGHRRIACISGPLKLSIARDRVRGWREALQAAGVVPQADWCVEGDFGVESGHALTLRLLAHTSITAVLASNDQMALGALRAAAQSGRPVPAALSVVGIDGVAPGRYTVPALTTVGADLRALGGQAALCLIERIRQPERPLRHVRREVTLVLRESTAPPLNTESLTHAG